MVRLSLSLLGTFQALIEGVPIKFESDKARALLIYLAVEADRAHRRDELTGLLWPGRSEHAARRALSQALYNIRTAIRDREASPPFLLITRETLQFNVESDYWLDTAALLEHFAAYERHPHQRLESCPSCLGHLEEIISLYHGDFLQGFSLPNSAPFEEWCVIQRERLHKLAGDALHLLITSYEQRGEYDRALWYARRYVTLHPLREDAHRQLMRLLALAGRQGEALAQFETCRSILQKTWGDAPAGFELCQRLSLASRECQ
ncbi:MAG: hypothetical protein J7M34_05130 [Anaerolineae bacterium]|nr:hypothetical protein [Anaerolineae bacterium]